MSYLFIPKSPMTASFTEGTSKQKPENMTSTRNTYRKLSMELPWCSSSALRHILRRKEVHVYNMSADGRDRDLGGWEWLEVNLHSYSHLSI